MIRKSPIRVIRKRKLPVLDASWSDIPQANVKIPNTSKKVSRVLILLRTLSNMTKNKRAISNLTNMTGTKKTHTRRIRY
jgi:hypothetical protein